MATNEAEQSVLGALMLNNAGYTQVADMLNSNDFSRPEHRLLYTAIRSLCEVNTPCDIVTLSEFLASRQELDAAGGFPYLGQLARNTPSAANLVAYATLVREHSILRNLGQCAYDIAQTTHQPNGKSSSELLDEAEQKIFALAQTHGQRGQGFLQVSGLLPNVLEYIDHLARRPGVVGLPTGFDELDEMTTGLHPSDLIILAARPSQGKTALAMNIAEHVAIDSNVGVGVFSMEMSSEQLIMRLLASKASVGLQGIRTGRLTPTEWTKLTTALAKLEAAPIFIDDTGGLSPTELRARARRLVSQQRIGLIVIDYLQLMQIPNTRETRANEVSEISRSLKALAKELKIPIIALSQLNRNLEQRTSKKPMMSDLRESGSLEQDADVILFIYRDEMYNNESLQKGLAEIIIAKQRNGPTGSVNLIFSSHLTKFLSGEDITSGSTTKVRNFTETFEETC